MAFSIFVSQIYNLSGLSLYSSFKQLDGPLMLPWKTILKINPRSKRPIYLQIADLFALEITKGRLSAGSKLPSSRKLAEELRLNRKTVLLAYDELLAQGWTEVIPSKGTFIKDHLPLIEPKKLSASDGNVKSAQPKKQASKTHQITEGIPDYRIAPIQSLYRNAKSLTKGIFSRSILTGEHFEGSDSLRDSLTRYLNETRALNPTLAELLITRGSQMSIFLAFSAILPAGDKVIVGKLNYESANQTIQYLGGQLVEIDICPTGLDIDQIELAVRSQSIKAIYISPHHHYPTTVTMPVEHRLRLLELSEKYNFYILEDDYDYDYHYNGSPILPMASIDQGRRVIYIGSFSKIFAPSIRIGYMYANEEITAKCVAIRKLIDRRGDPIVEKALSILIEEKEIHRSIKKAVNIYRDRRDLFCKLLKESFKENVSFDVPDGGMAVWVAFRGVRIQNLIRECEKLGLHLDVETYSEEGKCRLGFASMNELEIEQNIGLLAKAAKAIES
ncbi:MAG: PLP-dependent aminotransferase family protein [Cyclobacteriaceae bacterium]